MKNTKLIYGGIIILLMLASGFVANDVIFDETKDLSSIIDILTGKPSLPEQTQEPQELTEQAILITPENPNEWQESQTYHTTVDFQKSVVRVNDYNYQVIPTTHSVVDISYYEGFEDDADYWGITSSGAGVASVQLDTFIDIYAGHKGILSWEYRVTGFDNSDMHVTALEAGTASISANHIDGNGFISIFSQSFVFDTSNDITGTFYVLNLATLEWDEIAQVDETYNYGSITQVQTLIDYLYFESDDLVSNIRSERRSIGNSINEFKVTVDNPSSGTTITINKPTDQNFSAINPIADTFEVGNDLIINGTINTNYEVYFTSKTEQYMALEDRSRAYFSDIGFEGSWSNDWSNTSSDEWSINLTSNNVFSGVYSLNLTSASSITTYCSLDSYLYPAKYLITFVYYRTTVDPIYFYWWDNDQWNSEALLTITDRWIKHTGQYNITGDTGGYNIAFATAETDQVIYIDDFKSWRANGQVRTTGYANDLMQTGMFATMRNIDLYDNPVVPYYPINVKLIDRSSDGIILSYNTFTDENGRTQVSFVLPFVNQMDNMEYTYRVTSLLTNEYIDSYFTPIRVEYYDYFMIENYTYYGIGGIDFTENWDDRATYINVNDNQSSGVNMIRPTGTVSDFRIKFHNINDINANYYEYVSLKLRTNVSDLSVSLYNQSGQYIGTLANLPLSTGELDWTTVTWNLTEVSTWTGIQGGFEIRFDEIGGDGNVESNNFVWIDQIHLFYLDEPLLIDTATYGYLTTIYNEFVYYIVLDGIAQQYVFDLDPFLYDLTEGNHEISITPFLDLSRRYLCYIPGETAVLQYSVAEIGVMKIIYHDQSGYIIDFDQFKTYIDDVRLYEQYVYFLNTSMSFNLTVTDIFDNVVYQNTTESFEYFKEIQMTLYSVKIQNIQNNPIWFRIQRGSKYYSEWIFSFEVIEYRLEEADYDIYVYYSDVATNFSVATNGTYVSYSYTVDSDTAIRVTGTTIEDVFNNVIALSQNLDSVNASIHDQIINVNISLSNQNLDIENQVINVDIRIANTNTTLFSQVNDFQILIENWFSGNFTEQTNQIEVWFGNINGTIDLQTNTIGVWIENNQTEIQIQINTFQNFVENWISGNFSSQTNIIEVWFGNINGTIDLQTNTIGVWIENNNTELGNQINTFYLAVENWISGNFSSQTNIIEVWMTNINGTIDLQTNTINATIWNSNDNITVQINGLNYTISNVNSTLYEQGIEIITRIQELQGIYRVHFDIVDTLGIGLPWETFFIFVNDTRLYKQDMIYSNATPTILNVNARDNFNVSVFNATYSITNHTDVVIVVMLYEMFLFNNGNYTAYVEIYRDNHLGLNITIPIGQAISFRVTSGTYDYKVYYYEEEIQNINMTGSPATPLMSWGKTLLKIGQFTVSAKIPKMIDVSTPMIKEVVKAAAGWAAFLQGFLQGVTIAAVGGAVAGFIVFTVLKEGWIGFKVGILKKAPGDSLIKPDILERKEDELELKYLATHESDSRFKYNKG